MEKTEYFVYCGFFIMHDWTKRFVQIAKEVFLGVPIQNNGTWRSKKNMIYSVERPHLKGVDAVEITDTTPEQDLSQDILTELIDEDFSPIPSRRGIRPEAIMAIIAALCALLLAATVVICLPYINAEEVPAETAAPAIAVTEAAEDPEILIRDHVQEDPEPLPTIEPIIEPESNPYGSWCCNRNGCKCSCIATIG